MTDTEKKVKDFIKQRTEERARYQKQLDQTKQAMKAAETKLRSMDTSNSFDEFQKVRSEYADLKAYYEMLLDNNKVTEEEENADHALFNELNPGIVALIKDENEAAKKECKKAVAELVKIFEKHLNRQKELNDLIKECANVMHVDTKVGHETIMLNWDNEIGRLYKEVDALHKVGY